MKKTLSNHSGEPSSKVRYVYGTRAMNKAFGKYIPETQTAARELHPCANCPALLKRKNQILCLPCRAKKMQGYNSLDSVPSIEAMGRAGGIRFISLAEALSDSQSN